MLTEVYVEHFKCFEELSLPLKPLTLLTGVNASGKSTIIQALTLLHQTAIDTRWNGALALDGSVESLGTFSDVVDQAHGRLSFAVGLAGENFRIRWLFESARSDKRDIAVPLQEATFDCEGHGRRQWGPNEGMLPAAIRATTGGIQLAKVVESLSYICAERTGPREVYPLADPTRHRTVGVRGELSPGLLYWFGDQLDQPVSSGLRLQGPPTLARQTEAWLRHFFPGAGYAIQAVPGANLVTLGLRTSEEEAFHRAQNVGFGLSHVFPIIVDVLRARPGDLIAIENPEVHLHPHGQAQMGSFLARASQGGVQIVVETHSDHVLNGVRRAVRSGQASQNDTAIHFFVPRAAAELQRCSQVTTLTLDRTGNIDSWPDGFFDQFDKDTAYLAGLQDEG